MKFSELSLDMFRMLQTLEREPQEELNNPVMFDQSPAPGRQPGGGGGLVSTRQATALFAVVLYSESRARLYTLVYIMLLIQSLL